MLTITPFLWFETQAEEAMELYTSIFPNSKVIAVHGPKGRAMSVQFELEGQRFTAMNGGPKGAFNDAISFFVGCETQEEIDRLWDKLTANGGKETQCGWLRDRFGVAWQIIPNALGRMLSDPDRAKSSRAMQAMLQMKKLDLAALQAAYDGWSEA